MAKKLKGFSLAEVLITLLVVGIVGAAAIPTMTKRSTGTDKMWDWADYPVGSAYSVGTHVLLNASADNANRVPELENNYFSGLGDDLNGAVMANAELEFDKLILMNNFHQDAIPAGKGNNFAKPHISFYNKYRSGLNTVTDYAGSLTADRTNLALGIGSLQRLVPTATEGLFNTAVGHYALMTDSSGNENTALGHGALMTLANVPMFGTQIRENNVAIGAESQIYNSAGSNNTSVGFNSLTATPAGDNIFDGIMIALSQYNSNNNIALGANALASTIENKKPVKTFFNNNIAIGANAGFDEDEKNPEKPGFFGLVSWATKLLNSGSNRLFIGAGQDNSLINADMGSNSFFNINADELIVNTADGTHTILKIRMVDDSAVSLPEFNQYGYVKNKLGYCQGEGTADTTGDINSLAEICIAKFSNLKKIVYEDYTFKKEEDGKMFEKFIGFIKQLDSNIEYAMHEPEPTTYTDWDIFIKRLNVGHEGSTSSGSDSPAYIQTVKASLNYLDTWKEGMGLVNMFIQSFTNNFLCFFQFLGADCETANSEGPMTLSKLIEDKLQELCLKLDPYDVLLNCKGTYDSLTEGEEQSVRQRKYEACVDADIFNILKCDEKYPDIASTGKKVPKIRVDAYNACKKANILGLMNCEGMYPDVVESDIRLKNVEGKSTAGLKEINALKIKNYTYKADKAQTPHVGVIAQELQQVFPNSVIEGSDGYLRIKKEEMFFAMVNAIKELDEQSIELKEEIPKVNKQIKTTVDKNKKLLTKNEKLKLENEKLMAQLKELEK